MSILFTGTIPALTPRWGTAFSFDFSPYFSGSNTPFTYVIQTGVLPSGLTLDINTGQLTGTPDAATVGSAGSFTVRAENGIAETADTNTFNITVLDPYAYAVTELGQDGPAAARPHLVFPEDETRVVTYTLINSPASGVFTMYPNTSFTLSGASDGEYDFQFDLYVAAVWRGRYLKRIKVGP